jgi:UDP:flavonoid glycosyltransferase YjiC (YdhE family)
MRLALLASGSTGDVRPFVALGVALRQAGHEVRIVTDPCFRLMAEAAGLEHAAMEGDIRARLSAEGGLEGVTTNPLRLFRLMRRLGHEMAPAWARDSLAGCEGAEALVAANGAAFIAQALAERLNLPLIQGWLQPVAPTGAFSTPLMPPLPVHGAPARWTHRLMRRLIWSGIAGPTGVVRQHLGLRPLTGRDAWAALDRCPAFCAVSPHLVPRPSDWPARIEMTGFLFLDQPQWQPAPALEAFLAAGEPPLYVGFGSMIGRDSRTLTRLVVEALRRLGRRSVVALGWGGLDRAVLERAREAGLPIHLIEEAPHDRLLPRMAAALHHGGAGTTAAALRAGLPSAVLPFLADQPFWADRLHRVGAAPPALPRRSLDSTKLVDTLTRALDDPALRASAKRLGAAIREENGATRASHWIEVALRPSHR